MATTTQHVRSQLQQVAARWTARDTPLSLRPDHERVRVLGAVPGAEALALAAAPSPKTVPSFDPAVDWRMRNGANHVTSVKDQGGCGSCVSFACCALIESMKSVQGEAALDLSEADSHFCSAHGPTCNGWWPDACLDQAIARGICPEAQFPYSTAFPGGDLWAGPPQCLLHTPRTVVNITARRTLPDPVAVKNYLTATGPVVACMTVYEDFYHYADGVYYHVTGNGVGGHCVLVIGYSEVDQYWLCKNSWGTGWGNAGFFRIAYTDLLYSGTFYPMYGAS